MSASDAWRKAAGGQTADDNCISMMKQLFTCLIVNQHALLPEISALQELQHSSGIPLLGGMHCSVQLCSGLSQLLRSQVTECLGAPKLGALPCWHAASSHGKPEQTQKNQDSNEHAQTNDFATVMRQEKPISADILSTIALVLDAWKGLP